MKQFIQQVRCVKCGDGLCVYTVRQIRTCDYWYFCDNYDCSSYRSLQMPIGEEIE
jgi:hypothetical protein